MLETVRRLAAIIIIIIIVVVFVVAAAASVIIIIIIIIISSKEPSQLADCEAITQHTHAHTHLPAALLFVSQYQQRCHLTGNSPLAFEHKFISAILPIANNILGIAGVLSAFPSVLSGRQCSYCCL